MERVLDAVFGQGWARTNAGWCIPLRCLVLRSGSRAVITGRRLSKCRRERVRPCWTALAHEPVEVRSWPQHDVTLRHEFVVVALAGALSEPRTDLARFDPHRFLLGHPNRKPSRRAPQNGFQVGSGGNFR